MNTCKIKTVESWIRVANDYWNVFVHTRVQNSLLPNVNSFILFCKSFRHAIPWVYFLYQYRKQKLFLSIYTGGLLNLQLGHVLAKRLCLHFQAAVPDLALIRLLSHLICILELLAVVDEQVLRWLHVNLWFEFALESTFGRVSDECTIALQVHDPDLVKLMQALLGDLETVAKEYSVLRGDLNAQQLEAGSDS